MHPNRTDDLVAIMRGIADRDPAQAACLALVFGPHRPVYGKVTVTFQNGNILVVGKEETFRPVSPLTPPAK